ncbi:hypothetical protein CTAYLR_006678 [Chrysophaeum taylorii]|uniref:Uncharacterized protein n=1 Tax=Chrysophaeum taylorii TaxID=2483200 RepID=A0AAD7UEB2_9STRA|nr:hypothetical protein CTAYLR_006678 [Chrysophaeum taylorii]
METHAMSAYESRQSVQEAFEDAALRRRRREVELKRLQVEDAKLELERAQLQQSRSRPRGRGTGGGPSGHKFHHPLPPGAGRGGSGPKPGAARKQRRGQGSLERRREARAAAREAALAQNAVGEDSLAARHNLRSPSAPSVLVPTVRFGLFSPLRTTALQAPPFEPASVRQRQGDLFTGSPLLHGGHQLRGTSVGDAAAAKSSRPAEAPQIPGDTQRAKYVESTNIGLTRACRGTAAFHALYSHVAERQPTNGRVEDSKRGPDHVSQMGSARWAGWTMICDMLNDSEPSNRASAVNTLRVMTNDQKRLPGEVNLPVNHESNDVAAWNSSQALLNNVYSPTDHEDDANEPGFQTRYHHADAGDSSSPEWQLWWHQLYEQQRQDAAAQRDEACQAVLEHGAVGQLVGLLNPEERVETQIAAAHVLRNVVSHAARQPDASHGCEGSIEPTVHGAAASATAAGGACDTAAGARGEHTIETDDVVQRESLSSFGAHGLTFGGEEGVRVIMEEADVVRPIIDLLESEDAVVRSSALGTVSELAHASEEARQHFFQEPALLSRLLNVVEQAPIVVAQTAGAAEEGSTCEEAQEEEEEGAEQQFDVYNNFTAAAVAPITESSSSDPRTDAGEPVPTYSRAPPGLVAPIQYVEDESPKARADVSCDRVSEPAPAGNDDVPSSVGLTDESMTRAQRACEADAPRANELDYAAMVETTAAHADRAQAMGVLKLMLDEEESAQRVRDAIEKRPGVVESIVHVATQALPPGEEAALLRSGFDPGPPLALREAHAVRAANDALLGLGGNSREVAATAVVQLLEQQADEQPGSSNQRSTSDVMDDNDKHSRPARLLAGTVPPEDDRFSTNEDESIIGNYNNRGGTDTAHDDEDEDLEECDDYDDLDEHHLEGEGDHMMSPPGLATSPPPETHPADPAYLETNRHRRRRQLAAMATLRNLVTTPDPTADEEPEQHVPDGVSLRAVRNAGGVDAVVSLLGHEDPLTQASASLTLRALVKADDKTKRHAKHVRRKRRVESGTASSDEGDDHTAASPYDLLDAQHTPPGDIVAASSSDLLCDARESDQQTPDGHATTADNGCGIVGPMPELLPKDETPSLDDGAEAHVPPEETDGGSLRAELVENELAIPRLVSVLSRGKEQPAAAVQAAAALVALVADGSEASSEDRDNPQLSDAKRDLSSPTFAVPGTAQSKDEPLFIPAAVEERDDVYSDYDVCNGAAQSKRESYEGAGLSSSTEDSTYSATCNNKPRQEHMLIKQQLRHAIESDSSVIPAIVELLQDTLEAGSGASGVARNLAETLRAIAASDLVNQMRIRDAGGVRPLMAVLAQAQQDDLASRKTGDVAEVKSNAEVASASAPDSSNQHHQQQEVFVSSHEADFGVPEQLPEAPLASSTESQQEHGDYDEAVLAMPVRDEDAAMHRTLTHIPIDPGVRRATRAHCGAARKALQR